MKFLLTAAFVLFAFSAHGQSDSALKKLAKKYCQNLKSQSMEDVVAARRNLRYLGKHATQAVANTIGGWKKSKADISWRNTDTAVIEALQIAGDLKDERIAQVLIDVATDTNTCSAFRCAALFSLGNYTSLRKSSDCLISILEAKDDKDTTKETTILDISKSPAYLKRVAAIALGKSRDKAYASTLVRALENKTLPARLRAAAAIGLSEIPEHGENKKILTILKALFDQVLGKAAINPQDSLKSTQLLTRCCLSALSADTLPEKDSAFMIDVVKKEALPELLRRQCLLTLTGSDHSQLAAELDGLMKTSHPSVAVLAAVASYRLDSKNKDTLTVCLDVIDNNRSTAYQKAYATLMLGHFEEAAAVDALKKLASDSDPLVALNAVRSAASIKTQNTTTCLIKGLMAPDPITRAESILALSDRNLSEDLLDILREQTQCLFPQVRSTALSALEGQTHKDLVKQLKRSLGDDCFDVRINALLTATVMNNKRLTSAIKKMSGKEDVLLNEIATACLEWQNKGGAPSPLIEKELLRRRCPGAGCSLEHLRRQHQLISFQQVLECDDVSHISHSAVLQKMAPPHSADDLVTIETIGKALDDLYWRTQAHTLPPAGTFKINTQNDKIDIHIENSTVPLVTHNEKSLASSSFVSSNAINSYRREDLMFGQNDFRFHLISYYQQHPYLTHLKELADKKTLEHSTYKVPQISINE